MVADRGNTDFKMLFRWIKEKITFVIKLKEAIKCEQVEEFPLSEGKAEHILKDEKIRLTGMNTKDHYPECLRPVVVYSETEKADVEIITKNFTWTALITLLLLKYLKEISKYGWSLSNLIAFLRMNLFVKIPLTEWLDNPFKPPEDFSMKNRQESLF